VTPTPQSLTDSFQYTCQAGTATDSQSGLACSEGYYGTELVYRNGTWWTVNTYCMTAATCTKTEGKALDEYSFLPCVPRLTTNGIVLDCKASDQLQTWNVHAEVNTSCPVNQVIRAPYPRSLVNVPTNFILEPAGYNNIDGYASEPQSPANWTSFIDANGNPTKLGYDASLWKDLRLIMRSQRFNGGETWFGQTVPKPQWTFADRDWNTTPPYPKQQEGGTATYTYQTSSAGLPTEFGRSFDAVNKVPGDTYTLPAYGVTVKSYCGHEWKVTITMAARTWHPSGACYETFINPDGTTHEPEGTSSSNCDAGWVSPGDWSYGWQDFSTDFAGIDLTQIGRTTSYDLRTRTISGGAWDGVVSWDQPQSVWVPVIEVQSVLRKECVAAGTCDTPTTP